MAGAGFPHVLEPNNRSVKHGQFQGQIIDGASTREPRASTSPRSLRAWSNVDCVTIATGTGLISVSGGCARTAGVAKPPTSSGKKRKRAGRCTPQCAVSPGRQRRASGTTPSVAMGHGHGDDSQCVFCPLKACKLLLSILVEGQAASAVHADRRQTTPQHVCHWQ